jgi:hypothetical protein
VSDPRPLKRFRVVDDIDHGALVRDENASFTEVEGERGVRAVILLGHPLAPPAARCRSPARAPREPRLGHEGADEVRFGGLEEALPDIGRRHPLAILPSKGAPLRGSCEGNPFARVSVWA